jgi:RNA polymerase-binding transcription factor DksA
MNILKLMLPLALLSLMACEKQGPMEKAGEQADNAVETVQDELDDAADEAQDKLEQGLEEAAEKVE